MSHSHPGSRKRSGHLSICFLSSPAYLIVSLAVSHWPAVWADSLTFCLHLVDSVPVVWLCLVQMGNDVLHSSTCWNRTVVLQYEVEVQLLMFGCDLWTVVGLGLAKGGAQSRASVVPGFDQAALWVPLILWVHPTGVDPEPWTRDLICSGETWEPCATRYQMGVLESSTGVLRSRTTALH